MIGFKKFLIDSNQDFSIYKFPNNYGVAVHYEEENKRFYFICTLKFDNVSYEIKCIKGITGRDGTIGYLTGREVRKLLKKVRNN